MTPEKRLETMPGIHNGLYKRLYKKAMTGKFRAAAMKSFCLECLGFDKAGIGNCTDTGCPLYPYRPYQKSEEDQDDDMTVECDS